MEEFLRPSFAVEPLDDVAADASVTLIIDPERAAALRAAESTNGHRHRAEVFVLDSRVARHPVWRDDGNGLVIFDEELEVFYTIDLARTRVEILASTLRGAARTALMRVVRELSMQSAAGDRVLLHAAALEAGGQAVAILGPKRAGKTTLLLHLLQASGARFIANDRLFVEAAPPSLQCTGLPSIVSVRGGTLTLFPAVDARATASGYAFQFTLEEHRAHSSEPLSKDRDLTPAQLCDVMSVSPAASAPVGAVLFVGTPATPFAGMPATGGVELLAPEVSAQKLRENLFAGGRLGRGTSVFATLERRTPNDTPEDYSAACDRVCDRLARTVPAFACRVEERALPNPRHAEALVDRLLSTDSRGRGSRGRSSM